VTLDTALPRAGMILQPLLLILLAKRRLLCELPVFSFYLGFGVLTIFAGEAILRFSPTWYLHFYLVNICGDALLGLCVLAELGRSVLRCNRRSSSKWPLALLLLVPASLLIWPLAHWTIPPHLSLTWILCFRLEQTIAILQVASLLALVWWSNLLHLRWPDRELRIASGLCSFSLVALLVAVVHTHQAIGPEYHWLDQAASASYLGVLAYWVVTLRTKSNDDARFLCTNPDSYVTCRRNGGIAKVTKEN